MTLLLTILFLAASSLGASAQFQNPNPTVTQSGLVTVGHVPKFCANGVICDGGIASGTVSTGVAGEIAFYATNGAVLGGSPAATISGGNLSLGAGGASSALQMFGTGANAVVIRPNTSTTQWIMTLPINAGTNGQTLITDGNGNTSWAAGGGGGGVNMGTAGQLAWYATTGSTVSGSINATISNGTLTLGQAGSILGSLILSGSSSQAVTITPLASAGNWTLTLPPNAGLSGQVLTTDGTGISTWTSASGGSPGGSTGQIQYKASASAFGGFTMSGDCTTNTSTGVITCTATSGTAFGTFATANAATPPAIGGTTPAAGTFSSITDSGITGSVQCLQVNTVGLISGTGSACSAGGSSIANVQDFLATTNFTPGVTTSLTLSSVPTTASAVAITFDGIKQSADTWSLASQTITFKAAIPVNTQVVEVQWITANLAGGVTALGGATGSIGTSSPLSVAAGNLQLGVVPLSLGGMGASQAAATANQFPVYPGAGGAAVPTGFASFLNALCSSSVGQYWVQLSSGWGCTGIGFANPIWWGADSTGTNDSTSAFNSAMAASARVFVPPGTFKLASQLAFTFPATVPWTQVLEGSGSGNTTLLFPTANGTSWSLSSERHSIRMAHLRLATSQSNTGTAISATNSQCLGATLFSMNLFEDLLIDGDNNSTHYWATAASLNTISGDTWMADTISGRRNSVTDTTGGGNGIVYSGPATCTIGATTFQGSNIYHYINSSTLNQLSVAVKAGNGTQGIFLQQVDIQNGGVGVCVPGTGSGSACGTTVLTNVNEISVIGSQIAVSNPIEVNSPAAVLTVNSSIVNAVANNFPILSRSGTVVFISQNEISGCGTGVGIYTNGSNGAINGNLITGCTIGVELDTSASFNTLGGNTVVNSTNAVFVNGVSNTIVGNGLNGSGSCVDLTASSSANRVFANYCNGAATVDAGTNNKVGQTCAAPTASFASEQGVVTHC